MAVVVEGAWQKWRQTGGLSLCLVLLYQSWVVQCGGLKVIDQIKSRMEDAMSDRILPLSESPHVIAKRWELNMAGMMSLLADDQQFNSNCLADLIKVGTSVHSLKMWALKMVDSFGKPGSHILRGNNEWPGSYYSCLAVEPDEDFEPSYCWVDIQVQHLGNLSAGLVHSGSGSGLPIRTAICIPDSCSGLEIYTLSKSLPDILNVPFYSEHINVTDVQCFGPKPRISEDNWAIAAICILIVITILVLLGTATEYYMVCKGRHHSSSENPSDAGLFWEILLCFSLTRNWKKITDTTPNENGLSSIHGLRALFVMWAIMSTSYVYSVKFADNPLDFLNAAEGNFIQFLLKAPVGLEGLFFLSALGITFYFLTTTQNKYSQGRVLGEYLFRFVRMWVPYMAIIFIISCGLGRYLVDGPFWFYADESNKRCQRNWWYSATYINNFMETSKPCMRHSWYMALDMQYYFLLPFILVPLARWTPMGFIIAGIVQGVSMIATALITHNKNIPSFVDLKTDRPGVGRYDEFLDVLYLKPYYHVGASLMGIVCGWTLYKIQRQAAMRKIWVIVGWLFCGLFLFFAVWGHTLEKTDSSFAIFYYTCRQLSLGLGLFWLVVACVTGYGGFINWFLTLPVWISLGRLAYCAYLAHNSWIVMSYLNSEVKQHFSYILMNFFTLCNIVVSFALAFILSVAFEAPIINLKRYFLETRRQYKRVL